MTQTTDPLIGTTYDGRYDIRRRIGAGGMANVYLADDATLGRSIAIKVLHQRYADDAQFIERFLREASAAARLNHPNIVQVYDRGQSHGSYYIAMEYVDGMTLKDLIRKRGALSEAEVLAYARQALHALRFAHRNGVVHRDIKPHNMMVDTEGRLKIADFGIARAGTDTGLTEAGSIVGTAQYLSPEQARGQNVAASSDLYSMGVVMYEMATGRVPFDGDSPVNVALRHVNETPEPPRTFARQLSPELEAIILHAMEKDPSQRYGSADEMLADLDAARDGGTTRAMTAIHGPAHTSATTQVLGATTVAPLTPNVGAAYSAAQPPEPAWPDDDEHEPRSRRKWPLILLVLLLLLIAGAAAALYLTRETGDPVPNVIGSTMTVARGEITKAGFKVGKITTEYSSDEAKNIVIDQDPGADAKAKPGSKIDVVVSKGPAPLKLPDVRGKPRAAAVAELRSAGFTNVEVTTEFSDQQKAGIVIDQTPQAGEKIQRGDTITLTVSKGVEQVGVPDVRGLSEADARTKLKAEGFINISTSETDSKLPQGTVISQDPSPGSKADPDTSIALVLASGKNEVPDVTGKTRDEAAAILSDAGFDADFVEVEDPSMSPGDTPVVESTDPSPGSRASLSTTIGVNLSVPPAAAPPTP